MSVCAHFLQEANLLLDLEELSFLNECDDLVFFYASIRSTVLGELFDMRDHCTSSELVTGLRVMQQRHEALLQKMTSVHADMKIRLANSKKQKQMFSSGSSYMTKNPVAQCISFKT